MRLEIHEELKPLAEPKKAQDITAGGHPPVVVMLTGGATDEAGGGLVARTYSTSTWAGTAPVVRAQVNMMSANPIELGVGTTSIDR
jgi:hypothetical protein